jgi:DNA-directed RNA polymerase subunit RPC12/RpoP
MSPSKRFEETFIRVLGRSIYVRSVYPLVFQCDSCKASFNFEEKDEGTKPKFCPMCGRRNSDA